MVQEDEHRDQVKEERTTEIREKMCFLKPIDPAGPPAEVLEWLAILQGDIVQACAEALPQVIAQALAMMKAGKGDMLSTSKNEKVRSVLDMDHEDRRSPLYRDNWPEWSSLIQDLVAPCGNALDILLGKVKEGDDGYSAQVDRELLAFLHLRATSECRVTIRASKRKDGNKGSKAYQALREAAVGKFRTKLDAGQGKDNLYDYKERMMKLFKEAEEYEFSFTEAEQVKIFISGVKNSAKARYRWLDMVPSLDVDAIKNWDELDSVCHFEEHKEEKKPKY